MKLPVMPEDVRLRDDFLRRFCAAKPGDVSGGDSPRGGSVDQRAGKLVEIVLARHYSATIDLRVYPGADCGRDFLIDDGRSVGARGVQVLRRMDYEFKLIHRPHESKPDVLALGLVHPDESAVTFAGWLTFVEFDREAGEQCWVHRRSNFAPGGDNPRTVPVSKLRRPETLVPWQWF